jgi:hypothetical protein
MLDRLVGNAAALPIGVLRRSAPEAVLKRVMEMLTLTIVWTVLAAVAALSNNGR